MLHLFYHENEWMYNNLPERLQNRIVGEQKKIDWNERDNILLPLVELAINNIIENNLNVRITKNMLKRETGFTISFDKRFIDRMPKVKKLVDESLETAEEFRKRKIALQEKYI